MKTTLTAMLLTVVLLLPGLAWGATKELEPGDPCPNDPEFQCACPDGCDRNCFCISNQTVGDVVAGVEGSCFGPDILDYEGCLACALEKIDDGVQSGVLTALEAEGWITLFQAMCETIYGPPAPCEPGPFGCGFNPFGIVDETEPVGWRVRIAAQLHALDGDNAIVVEPHKGERGGVFENTLGGRRPQMGKTERVLPMGSCDSDEECEQKTDAMCKGAGYADGVDPDTVTITSHYTGSKTCSGDCSGTSDRGTSGAVAFVTCNKPANETHTIHDGPDPVGQARDERQPEHLPW